MENYYIEGTSEILFNIMNNEKWSVRLPKYKTPSTGRINGVEIRVPEEGIPKLMKKVSSWKEKGHVKLYKREKEYYRPIVIKNENTLHLYTTFAYKMLERAEVFASKTENMIDANFLEDFEVSQLEKNFVRAFYQATTHIPTGQFIDATDTGTLVIWDVEQNQTHQVHSRINNIRFMVERDAESPYNELFGFPNENGITESEVIEHYIPYREGSVIHFADDIDIIELYKKTNKMELEPYYTFRKSKENKTLIEQDILKTIENYKKKMVGTSRNRVPSNN